MTSYILSDIPFMAACLCSLALSNLENQFLTRAKAIVLLSASVGIAFMLRQAGAALIFAGLIHFLLSGKRQDFYLFVAIVGVPNSPMAPLAISARLGCGRKSAVRLLSIVRKSGAIFGS